MAETFISSAEADTPKRINWNRAIEAVETLKAGDQVTGFTCPEEVDIFVDFMGYYVMGGLKYNNLLNPSTDFSLIGHKGRRTYRGWHTSSRPPSRAINPKNFVGKIEGITVLLMENPDKESQKAELAIFGSMRSTGRGVVGQIAKKCTVRRFSISYGRALTADYSDLNGHDADKAAELLRLKAKATRESVERDGLIRAFPGGLPGLGRR